jgi:acyl-lipid omega-6 desaturase (Delta-12 desaturase)
MSAFVDFGPKTTKAPSRKELRTALLAFNKKSAATALGILLLDYLILIGGIAAVALSTPWWVKTTSAIVIGLQIARLFIIGHDACHQSFTEHRFLNKFLGRIAFLPSLTPYKFWEIGHNLAHHSFTNLRGRDYVWTPYSRQEFLELSSGRQNLERFYRSGYGHWLYYFVELWWKRLYFTKPIENGKNRLISFGDSLLVTIFATFWIGGLYIAALSTEQNPILIVTMGFGLPFLIWNGLMGFVIYVHHTDPEVNWYADSTQWAKAQTHLTATIHVQFPSWFGSALHNIMEHPAHHLDMTIPLYRLQAAQRRLDELVPNQIVKRKFTLARYFSCIKTCKLYNFETNQWEPFP